MKRSMLVGLILTLAVSANAQSLRVSSAEVGESGQEADVCVSLDSGGQRIAGTQNDLLWDGACATLEDAGACRVNPDTGKDLNGRLLGTVTGYRGLVLSLSDVAPIPNGTLYCCRFRVEAMPHSCCAVSIANAGLSDDRGIAVAVDVGPPAQLCVGGFDGTPFATSTPTVTPVVDEDDVASASSDGDGCNVTPGSHSSGLPLLLLAAVILILKRRS